MGDSGRILIVCRANVCRSPFAETILTTTLGDMLIQVESAGVAAIDQMVCPLAAQWNDRAIWLERLRAHRPRQVSGALVSAADLILAASVSVRTELVRLAPASRHKVFTLREATLLGVAFTPTQPEPYGELAGDYAAYLDRRRARTAPLAEPRRRWARRPAGDLLSIPDNHGRRKRLHRDTLRQVAVAASTIARQLNGDSAA